MANSKMTKCKSCGNEIAVSAKTCPNCGAKNKKPIYKRPWFIVLVVMILISVASGGSDKDTKTTEPSKTKESNVQEVQEVEEQPIEYTAYTVDELEEDLEKNPMKASQKYLDQYVELTGKLEVIDSSGKYFSLVELNNQFAILGVHCTFTNDEQKDVIMDCEVGDKLVVKGQITDVGEVMHYSMKLDSVEKAS